MHKLLCKWHSPYVIFFRLVTNAKVCLMPHLLFNQCLWLWKATFDRPSGYISVSMEILLTGSGWEDLCQSLSHYIHKYNQKHSNESTLCNSEESLAIAFIFSFFLSGTRAGPEAFVREICGWPRLDLPKPSATFSLYIYTAFQSSGFFLLNRKGDMRTNHAATMLKEQAAVPHAVLVSPAMGLNSTLDLLLKSRNDQGMRHYSLDNF